MKAARILFISLALMGCSSNPISPLNATKAELIDDPTIGTTVTRNLGERLVAKGIRTTGEAIVVVAETTFGKATGEASILSCAPTVYPTRIFKTGIYKAGTNDSAECFGPVRYGVTTHDGSPNMSCHGNLRSGYICKDAQGQFFLSNFQGKRIDLKQDSDNLKIEQMAVTNTTNFLQELIYNGRSGDTIRLIYREYSDDFLRPAFSQDAQYDLSVSTEIGFRASRIRVINATNTSITYILEHNF